MGFFTTMRSSVAHNYNKIIGRVAPSLTGAVNQAKAAATRVASAPHLTAGVIGASARVFGSGQRSMLGGIGSRVGGAVRSGYALGGISGAMKAGRVVGGRAFRSIPAGLKSGAGYGAVAGAAYGLGTRDSSGHRGNLGRALGYGMAGAGAGYAGAGVFGGLGFLVKPPRGGRRLLSQFSSAGNEMKESYSSVAQAMSATARSTPSYESRVAGSGANAWGTKSRM